MNDKTESLVLPAFWLNKPALILPVVAALLLLSLSSVAQISRPERIYNRAEGRGSADQSVRQRQPAYTPRQQMPGTSIDRMNDRALRQNNMDYNRRRTIDRVPGTTNLNRPATSYNPRTSTRRPVNIEVNRYNNNYGYGANNNRVNRSPYASSYGYRRPVYSQYNPNWRYAGMPRRNSYFNTLPSSYLSIQFGGFNYRYYDGIYYRPYNNMFRVVAPPFGLFINTLPLGHRRIYVRDYPYYYYNGTYYDQRDDDRYVVVSPPVGAVVESIPDGYKTINIDGETYYTVDGAQYKPVLQENGEIWYEVIKSNDD
ncbi:MAG: DUF6515 family protein [Ferruginibacter sp.]|nr:DUF6515 family protein [Ferruginibacter sp.]